MNYRHVLVVLSGGQDSTTCLYLAKKQAEQVSALTFDYNQRHVAEVDAAHQIAVVAGVEHEVLRLHSGVLRGTSPLVNAGNEVERYANVAALPGGIEKTFVPMRNALFIVLAFNRAAVHGCDAIMLGVSQEDYGGYPDCRQGFIAHMAGACNSALDEAISQNIAVLVPLINLTKRATVELAATLPGCMAALAYSHTCYNGEVPPCGHCHACLLRAKGFAEAGVADPLLERLQVEA